MEPRRDFLIKMLGGATFLSSRPLENIPETVPLHGSNPLSYAIDNPYEGIRWNEIQFVPSATHVHVENQDKLDKVYHHSGLRHIPISNYYPSAPYYPAEKIRHNQFMKQDFGVVYSPDDEKKGKERWNNAQFLPGPIDWNEVIMNPRTGWFNELPDDLKAKLPFKTGDYLFPNIPKDVIISPNAEHHSFTDAPLHACAVGSLFASGDFDAHSVFKTLDHGYSYGTGLPWKAAFKKMLDQLLFKDAGGITINHPVWSGLNFEQVAEMLDYDSRVMGIEVFNDTCFTAFGNPEQGWALKLWDSILKTNRRCLGFFVPDHQVGLGRNILLVPAFTEYECLKAYRKGAFFGALTGAGVMFTQIQLSDNELKIGLNKPGAIRIMTNAGEAQKGGGTEASFKIPLNEKGVPSISYVRVEVSDENSEQIFSQPIRFLS
jgi:hypothetical protein